MKHKSGISFAQNFGSFGSYTLLGLGTNLKQGIVGKLLTRVVYTVGMVLICGFLSIVGTMLG